MAIVSQAGIKRQFANLVRAEYISPIDYLIDMSNGFARIERRRRALQIAANGVVLPAYVIQANSDIWKPGPSPQLPALVLTSFDPRVMNDKKYMMGLVKQLVNYKGTAQNHPELAYVAAITTDERAVNDRRRVLPPAMTGGPEVFALDILLQRSRLDGGYLGTNTLTILAEPGPLGCADLIPSWMADGQNVEIHVETFWTRLISRSSLATTGLVALTLTAALLTSNTIFRKSSDVIADETQAGAVIPSQSAVPAPVQKAPGINPFPQDAPGAPKYRTPTPLTYDPRTQRLIYVTPAWLRHSLHDDGPMFGRRMPDNEPIALPQLQPGPGLIPVVVDLRKPDRTSGPDQSNPAPTADQGQSSQYTPPAGDTPQQQGDTSQQQNAPPPTPPPAGGQVDQYGNPVQPSTPPAGQ
jgi:hypothetical protein